METYDTKAIILRKSPFREYDCRVSVYTLDQGKIDLVVRGSRKLSSKLAGHIEPLTESKIMVVKGKGHDYIGSAVNERGHINIKKDLEKLEIAGKAIRVFNDLIKEEERDIEIYHLLREFLFLLNEKNLLTQEKLLYFYYYKLLAALGYRPELFNCIKCREKINPDNNYFDFLKGGLVCKNCERSGHGTEVSDNAIKVLRLVSDHSLEEGMKIRISDELFLELRKIVVSFLEYVK